MMLVSKHSRKQMKKTAGVSLTPDQLCVCVCVAEATGNSRGTANTSWAMLKSVG